MRFIHALVLLVLPAVVSAQTSTYTVSIPQPESGSMLVELVLTDVPRRPLTLHMSASSPGRYGPHDFVRHVTSVAVETLSGTTIAATHPTATEWRVSQPPSTLRVRYRVAGNTVDGTQLAIDGSHAHINMPASLMWGSGFENGAMTVRFDLPQGRGWRVATQLFPGPDAITFTAPNLPYLMDSPTELSAFSARTFTVEDGGSSASFRLAVHHEGTDAELDTLTSGAERIVRQAARVFGEFPGFETGAYTFIADYRPRNVRDGMEHRNSTVLTSPTPLATSMAQALDTISHEFVHAWNVERVRPRSLEPFDLTRPNPSNELWLAEGFTQYYGKLLLARAGLISEAQFADDMGRLVGPVLTSPARRRGSLEDMSRLAARLDSDSAPPFPNVEERFLSYYTWGGAVALALDLSLRARTDDRVTLDDFMRLLWTRFGRPGGRAPGLVERPYTREDLVSALADLSGDRAFARTFFARYIDGRDAPDYGQLLGHVGFVLRESADGARRSGLGVVLTEQAGGSVTPAQQRARATWLTGTGR